MSKVGEQPPRRRFRPRSQWPRTTTATAAEVIRRRKAGDLAADIGHDLGLSPIEVLDIARGDYTVS